MSVSEEMRTLLEGKNLPQTLESMRRWLKGATPTVTHYHKKMADFSGNAPRDAAGAAHHAEVAGAVGDLFAAVKRLQGALDSIKHK